MRKIIYTVGVLFLTVALTKAQQPVPASPQTKSILLIGGTAHLGDGTVIEKSAIAFTAGMITLVKDLAKENIDKSTFEEVIDISGKHVYPGFIAPNSTLGLVETEAVRATRDFSEVGGIIPNVRSLIAYNTDSRIIPTVRSNGVLLAQTTPRDGFISGTSTIVELDGWNWEDAAYKQDDGIHINWPKMLNRHGWWAEPGETEKNKEYDKQVDAIKKFIADAKAYAESQDIKETNLRFEAMRGIFNGKQTLFIHTDYAKEIIECINVCQQSKLKKVVLVGGKDSWMVTDFLKQHNIPVIVSRVHDLPQREEDDVDLPYKLPYLLKQAGILFCLNNEGSMETMGTRNLPFYAGTAAAYGLTKEEALMSVTSSTAKILGIDDKVGTIAEGKDATIIVSTGDALDMRTNNIELAYIRGKKIDLNTDQKVLYEIYKKKYGL